MTTPLSGNTAAARYKAVQVNTCTPAQLVGLLYDGLVRFLGEATTAIENNDRARAGERIGRSHAILEQLALGLDPSHAPELCANLEAVYAFCMHRLLQANLEQNPAIIAEVVRVITPLREGWKELLVSQASNSTTP